MFFVLNDMFTNIRSTHVDKLLNKPCYSCLDAKTQYITYFAIFFAYYSSTEVLRTERDGCRAFM